MAQQPRESSAQGAVDDPRQMLLSIERQLAKSRLDANPKVEAAQQLVYEAMSADSLEDEAQMVDLALELDPGNIDALVMALRRKGLRPEAEAERLRRILELASEQLGPEEFAANAGSFWGAVQTRPYMRTRAALAETLWQAKRFEDAVAEWEAMLKLNPVDNQGVRFRLIVGFLVLSQPAEAEPIFQHYDEGEWSVPFSWGRVLQRWMLKDESGAVDALRVARKQNGFAEAYLRGHRSPPRRAPRLYQPGSREEAAVFAGDLLQAWQAHPKAQSWLAQQPKRGPE